MNMGMGHLAISPSSPYDSQNASRVSLASNLQQQRGIIDQRTNGIPVSPVGSRAGLRPNTQPRRAPVIPANPRAVSGMPDPRAAEPTKGFPWAFPDSMPSEGRRGSRSSESSGDTDAISRQNSYAASVNSSVYTTESMPLGQKRFDDGKHILIRPYLDGTCMLIYVQISNTTITHSSIGLSPVCRLPILALRKHLAARVTTAARLSFVLATRWPNANVVAK